MKEVKTAQGLCRFTDDSLVLKKHLYYLLTRLLEHNKNLGWGLLLGLGMMAFAFFSTNPRTIANLLSFLEFLGWLLLFAGGLGLLIGMIGMFFKRDRLPSNLVKSTNIEIPLDSITQVTITDLGVGKPHPTILVSYQESDSQLTTLIHFYPGMNEQFELAIALFEQRGVQVEE